jgi:putative ABC transport system permease protein
MLRTALAGLRTHMLRLVLTALAISLGVAFVSGTFVLTGTMRASFDQHFTAAADKVSTAVLPRGDDEIPAAALTKVRGLPGVRDAQGVVRGDAPLIGRDGRVYGEAATMGVSIASGPLQRFTVEEGRTPSAPNQVVLDRVTAKRTGYGVGDPVKVLDRAGTPHAFTVVGLMDFGVDQEIGYRGAVGFTGPTTAEMTGKRGFTEIDVVAAPGVGDEQIRTTVAAAVGRSYETLTGERLAEKLALRAGTDLKLVTLLFLTFALVALFVAALVIYNTFNILIAQRMREIALLRCVGATRAQVFGSVLIESVIVGLGASIIGVFGGIGLGAGAARIVATDVTTDVGALEVSPVSLLVGISVGLVVTVGSALLPARSATGVPPVAALRQAASSVAGRLGVGRLVAGGLCTVTGLAAGGLALATAPGQVPFLLVVVAASLIFLGVIAFSPPIVTVISRVVGWAPARWLGVPGRLAGENARRNPKRTAITTIALTVGITLMTMFSVALASLQATTDASLNKKFPVDYRLSTQQSSDQLVPAVVAERLRAEPGIAEVTEVRTAGARLNDEKVEVSSISQDSLGRTIQPEVSAGSLARLRPGAVALHTNTAKTLGARAGQTVSLRTAGGTTPLTVVAILTGDTPMPPITITQADFDRLFGAKDDSAIYVVVRQGVSADDSRRVIDDVVKPYPMVKVGSAADVKDQLTEALNRIFVIVAALLGVAIIISLIGIANTLSLSVAERTRESALLRALGLTRGGLRRMLSLEAVITSIIGALIGVTLGTAYGWAAISTVQVDLVLGFPTVRILAFILLAAAAGVLAAVLPARRAARTSIVTALADE